MFSNLTLKEAIFAISIGASISLGGMFLVEYFIEGSRTAYCLGLIANCLIQYLAYLYAKRDHMKKVRQFQQDLKDSRSACEKLWDEERIYRD